MKHPSKLPDIETTIFTTMGNLSKKHNAINLSQGFPNFKSDQKLIDLVSKAMNAGFNQYAPMLGVLELREAIAKKFDDLYKTSYNPENEIVVTAGATQAIFTIISAFIKPFDEVILFKPAYDCYEPAINLNGGKAISMQLNYPDYKVDWKAVENAISLDIVLEDDNWHDSIIAPKDALSDLQTLQLTEEDSKEIQLGRFISKDDDTADELVMAYMPDGHLLAVLENRHNHWKPHKVFLP